MISTVTTTVSTIVSSATTTSLVFSLGFAAVFTVIVSLAIRELTAHGVIKVKLLSQNLSVIVVPLLFVFALLLSITVWGVLPR